ncbi:unnamed protein product [Owenia fusiformis]|uniref:Uncharacterized protein n=1 Tax=Owenia fusiformis TaxID=6347 RepID=A0A8J1T606_OWEFU|nr:unnamed protein product [Owenia fusiformis]
MMLITCLATLFAFSTAQNATCRTDLNALWEDVSIDGELRLEQVEEDFFDLAALVSENGDGIPLADGVCAAGIDVATCLSERDGVRLCELTASADSSSDPQVITIEDIRVLFNRADATGNGVVDQAGFIRAATEVCTQLPDFGADEADCA